MVWLSATWVAAVLASSKASSCTFSSFSFSWLVVRVALSCCSWLLRSASLAWSRRMAWKGATSVRFRCFSWPRIFSRQPTGCGSIILKKPDLKEFLSIFNGEKKKKVDNKRFNNKRCNIKMHGTYITHNSLLKDYIYHWLSGTEEGGDEY